MASTKTSTPLAIHGGERLRQAPFPARGHIGPEEKAALDALFDHAIATGGAPRSMAFVMPVSASMNPGIGTPGFIRLW